MNITCQITNSISYQYMYSLYCSSMYCDKLPLSLFQIVNTEYFFFIEYEIFLILLVGMIYRKVNLFRPLQNSIFL